MSNLPAQTYQPVVMQVVSRHHQSNQQMADEHALVEEAKKNPERFAVLYDKYYEQIFRFIYQRMDDKDTAFDTTQQVFLKALLNLRKYEFRGVPFASWLYRIAKSEVNQLFRKNKTQRTVNIDETHLGELMDEMQEDTLEKYSMQLQAAISMLPEEELVLIEMRYFEKRPFKEIAEIMEITENNAKVKVYRVLEKLKKILIKTTGQSAR
jgi:RNA polymerase sigma-70 factor (ECF subfamily)